MKKPDDPRHQLRIETVKQLFEKSFRDNLELKKESLASKIYLRQKNLDKLIQKYAPSWPIEQIAPIDLVILRLAIWELAYSIKKEPYKVIIDEGVEIAKEFGSASSPSFVNGVLGTIVKSLKLTKHD